MSYYRDKRVLVTGAGSGIGRCLARQLAGKGARLILTDVNAAALAQTADLVREEGAAVFTRALDISDAAAVEDLARWVEAEVGPLDILINNAGIGHSGEIAKTDLGTWKKLIAVNFYGALHHILAFAPFMIDRKKGQIVTVSSGQAFFRLPGWGPYAVVKLMLGAMSEMLAFELAHTGVHVTTVYPFMVNTPFYREIQGDTFLAKLSMKLVPYYSMSPERVARIILRATEKRRRVEMVSFLNDMAAFAKAIPFAHETMSAVSAFFLTKRD